MARQCQKFGRLITKNDGTYLGNIRYYTEELRRSLDLKISGITRWHKKQKTLGLQGKKRTTFSSNSNTLVQTRSNYDSASSKHRFNSYAR